MACVSCLSLILVRSERERGRASRYIIALSALGLNKECASLLRDCILWVRTETERAAAAMDVHVGHFSDPDGIPGLAHFCEHMLFLGTKKYPDEASYSNFLSAHGGEQRC